MIVIIVFALLLGLITWILIAPIQLLIDTDHNKYTLSWMKIGSVELLPISNDFILRLRCGWLRKDYYLLELKPKKKSPAEKTGKRSKVSKAGVMMWRKARKIMQTFRVIAFRLHLDTNDYILNSYLFPIFYLLNRPSRELEINYKGESGLRLIIENRLYKILIALLF